MPLVSTIRAGAGTSRQALPSLPRAVKGTYATVPSYNVPTITTGSFGSTALASTVIPTSPGTLREKRTGVAESAAGAAQTSTAALDLTGSTRFRYPGIPSAAGLTSNPGQYVSSPFKPGSTASAGQQNARWLFTPDLDTDAPQVLLRLQAPIASPRVGAVYVDGQRVQHDVVTASGIGAGSGFYALLTFPDARMRRITIYGAAHDEGRFGGAAVPAGYSIVKHTAPITRRIAFITDSFGGGAPGTDGTNVLTTFLWPLAAYMNADEIINAGIGSTGWIAQLTDAASTFQGRIAPVLAMAPHALLFAGLRNDQNADLTALRTAIDKTFDDTASVPERYALRTSTNAASVNAVLAAACAAKGVKYLNVDIDALPKMTDGVHPTAAGHLTLADAAYALV